MSTRPRVAAIADEAGEAEMAGASFLVARRLRDCAIELGSPDVQVSPHLLRPSKQTDPTDGGTKPFSRADEAGLKPSCDSTAAIAGKKLSYFR
jgi:hypothetical protein